MGCLPFQPQVSHRSSEDKTIGQGFYLHTFRVGLDNSFFGAAKCSKSFLSLSLACISYVPHPTPVILCSDKFKCSLEKMTFIEDHCNHVLEGIIRLHMKHLGL